MSEQGENIVKTELQKVIIVEPEQPANEPLDLVTARLILETVVGIHENTLTETSDLTRVGGYDTDQVRGALKLVSQDILALSGGGDVGLGTSRVKKQTRHGELSLLVYRKISQNLEYGEPENLYMSLVQGGSYVLESEVPLGQSGSWVSQNSVRFADFRTTRKKVVSIYDINQGFSIDQFRHIWRGMRWLSANMLDWNREFRLPEDLDNLALPMLINPQLYR